MLGEFESILEKDQSEAKDSRDRLMKLVEQYGKGFSEMDQLIEDYKNEEIEMVETDDGWLLLKDKAHDELSMTKYESFDQTF